jgi:ribosomal protein S18 acetylase RimI-like enzyme
VKILDGKDYLPQIRQLIVEYTTWLGRDLSFQGLGEELDHLGDTYLPPHGKLFAAVDEAGSVKGCVAYKRWTDSRCEMKRLYVTPDARGTHLGRTLAEKIIQAAREDGYSEIVLDTLGFQMRPALKLYRSLGFEEIPPYYNNPLPDAIYMSLKLR